MLLNWHPGGFAYFLEADCQKRGINFFWGGSDLHRNYGMLVILLSFLGNYDNLTLKLYQEKHSYPDERWLFIGKFKVGSVPGMSVTLEVSKIISKSIKRMLQDH